MNKEDIKNNRAIRKVYYVTRGILKRRELKTIAEAALDEVPIHFSSEKEKRERINDMVRMERDYGFTAAEYINYRFEEKSIKERLEFVADWEHLGYTCAMNDPHNASLFDNKWKTYNRFQKYYKREMEFFDRNTSFDVFERFLQAHDRLIIKPLDLSCGKGIQIINTADYSNKIEIFHEWLDSYNNRFIAEELIKQSQELGQLHPASVNTVRMPTIRLDDRTVIVHPQLRMGQHGSVVDNAGAGGIKGAIDVETGVILSAVDNAGHTYEKHPDTGVNIVGFKIPQWEDAKKLVQELVQIVPENRYTGWDLAHTQNGWVLVEANRRAQFGFQGSLQKGFRTEVNGYLKALGTKY